MWQSQFDILAGERWWRRAFFFSWRRASNQPSVSRWSPTSWYSRSDPLSSRLLHNKSVIILNKEGKNGRCTYIWQWLVTLRPRVNWYFTSFSMSWTDLMWMSFNGEFRAWERETARSRWGNQTGAERCVRVWRTITFARISNLGWRLNGTPSRAVDRWVPDECDAMNTCWEKETEIADPPLIPEMLPSAGLSPLSLFLRVCLLWLSLLVGCGGGGWLLKRKYQHKQWTQISTWATCVLWNKEPVSSSFTGLIRSWPCFYLWGTAPGSEGLRGRRLVQ